MTYEQMRAQVANALMLFAKENKGQAVRRISAEYIDTRTSGGWSFQLADLFIEIAGAGETS